MKKIVVPKVSLVEYDEVKLAEVFSALEASEISNCNWPNEFPYTPQASFKAFHNGENFFLQFNVTEKDLHAKIADNFGKVWTDPCVEVFMALDEDTYYNFECTCIGRMLVACHAKGKETEPMSLDALEKIERYPSLGYENFELRDGEVSWSIIEVIPAAALFNHKVDSWDGLTMRANFYKCGDNLPNPHFLSWNKIDFPRPNFHLPEFFGEVSFE